MSDTAERFFAATLINEPYDPTKIHVSHDLECVDDVGHCKVCLEAWVGEVMTPGLAAPCTKVKPKRDPMTGQPVEQGGRKPPPTPTEWLDITARGGGLCVAWNSDHYLLTDAQARKLRDALSALLSEVKD